MSRLDIDTSQASRVIEKSQASRGIDTLNKTVFPLSHMLLISFRKKISIQPTLMSREEDSPHITIYRLLTEI